MTIFRPCIDLHEGRVKQIVGGTLTAHALPHTNFISDQGAAYYAQIYQKNGLRGGHIILLGGGNEIEAKAALQAYPGGLQIGGGINPGNAREFLNAGASHVIVTSWLFPDGDLNLTRLHEISKLVGKNRLVIDLSCRRLEGNWRVAIQRWQVITSHVFDQNLFDQLDPFCSEYLIHAADVEGLRQGVDWKLVQHLASLRHHPMTYAGGANDLTDLDRMKLESQGRMDLTIGSALDLFGGQEIRFEECVRWNHRHLSPSPP